MPTTFQDEVFKQRLSRREIWINGDINEELIERLVVHLLALDETEGDRKEPRPIKVYINSRGGNLRESLAAVDVMLSLNSPVETIALGCAMSGGLTLLMGGQSRKAYEHTTLMFHTSRGGTWGVLPDAESSLQHTKYLIELKAELFGSRTKRPKQDWLELLNSGRDRFFSTREALEVGILTEIIPRSARETRLVELPAPEEKPLLEEPKSSPVVELVANGAVEVAASANPDVAEEKVSPKKDKKRKKS